MRAVIVFGLLIVSVLFLGWYIWMYLYLATEYSANFQETSLRRLRPGMESHVVHDLLGDPLETKMGGYVVDVNGKYVQSPTALIEYYSKPLRGCGEESIVVISDGIVNGVFVEDCDLLIYKCNFNHCIQ